VICLAELRFNFDFAAFLGADATLTDLPEVMTFVQQNLDANAKLLKGKGTASTLIWGQTDLKEFMRDRPPFDLVLGSDLVYERELAELLLDTLVGVTGKDTLVMYSTDRRGRDGFLLFLGEVTKHFDVEEVKDEEQHPGFLFTQIRMIRLRKKALSTLSSSSAASPSDATSDSKSGSNVSSAVS